MTVRLGADELCYSLAELQEQFTNKCKSWWNYSSYRILCGGIPRAAYRGPDSGANW